MLKRKTLLVVALAAAVGLGACSTLTTNTDFRPNTDFSRFKTFAFKDVRQLGNSIMEARIKSAVSTQLTAKGWSQSDGSPDIWVVLHPQLSQQTQITTFSSGWGYGWGWRGGMGTQTSSVEQIPVGTLIVDLVDAREKELVWRGTASDTLRVNATPEERDRNLNRAMERLFQGFPPPTR
ncbi:MAG TPA: DUF4136 domain-containing protein [Thermoanaerobaculia bacterium]|nr:DUF4136 domain-containing protein [Thermoanaerobaculia bacterium]